jgi:hypothetical protein
MRRKGRGLSLAAVIMLSAAMTLLPACGSRSGGEKTGSEVTRSEGTGSVTPGSGTSGVSSSAAAVTESGDSSSNQKLSVTLIPHNQERGEDNSAVDDWFNVKVYSETYHTLRIDTNGFDSLKSAVKNFNDTTAMNADQVYKTMSGGDYGVYYDEDIDVLRADARVLSFIDNVYQYGGATDESTSTFRNFDSATGESVTLDEVVTDTSKLPALLMDAIPDGTDVESLTESSIASDIANGSLNWGIGYDGLHVLLADQRTASDTSADDEAAQTAGTESMTDAEMMAEAAAQTSTWTNLIEVTLRFADHPELFTDTYQSLPSSYGMTMEQDTPYTLTFASDGNAHTVEVKTDLSSDGYSVKDVTVTIDGKDSVIDLAGEYYYQVHPYYLHTEDGRDFIYLNENGEDDFSSVRAVRLDNGAATDLGDFTDSLSGWYLEDPADFRTTCRMDLFGTYSANRYCRVGDDGKPAAIDPLYDCQGNQRILRAKSDVPVQTLDSPGGSVTGDGTVSAGTYLYFQKTDGGSFVDFMTSDGQAVRIKTDAKSTPHTTNGTDESELFDGLMYAG